LQQIETFGVGWLDEAFRYIQEDKREAYLIAMAMLPLARTPMDEGSARAVRDLSKNLEAMIDGLVPWLKTTRNVYLAGWRKKVKPGTVVVIADSTDDPNDPLFMGAKVIR
jgi:hypothetical protein